MRRRTRRALVVALIVLAITGAVSFVALVGAADEGTPTLDELRQDGTHYANSPDSVRLSGDQMFWIVHWPADAIGSNVGEPDDSNQEYLSPGETVDRNSVWLRTINLGEPYTVDVTVAYYNVGERTVQREDNTTTTEQYAKNVTTQTHEIDIQRGWVMQEINLDQSDETREVTMWIDEDPSELRWRFSHRSVATTQPTSISTEGDYWSRVIMELLIPIVLGSFAVGGATRVAIKKAKVPPMWGYLRWLIVLTFGTGFAVLMLFSSLAHAIASAPILVAMFTVGIIGIVLLESDVSRAEVYEFIKPDLTSAKSPSGEEAVDGYVQESQKEYVIRTEEDGLVVIRPGLLPFLSRLFGGAAPLEGQDRIKTTMDVVEGDHSKKVWVDPDSESVIDYQPESWHLEMPELETRDDMVGFAAKLVGALVFAWLFWTGLSPIIGAIVLLLAGAVLFLRPTNGYARIDPAPAHLRSAMVSMLYLSIEHADAKTMEKAREKLVEEQARSQREIDEAVEKADRTLIREMHNSDPEDSLMVSGSYVDDDGGPDDDDE